MVFKSFCPFQGSRASLLEEEMQRGISKREHDVLRRDYLSNKSYNIVEIWVCSWWESVREEEVFRNHAKKIFTFKLAMNQESLSDKVGDEKIVRYVQCEPAVSDGINYKLSKFLSLFKKFNVS